MVSRNPGYVSHDPSRGKKSFVLVQERTVEEDMRGLAEVVSHGFRVKDKTIIGNNCIFYLERELVE